MLQAWRRLLLPWTQSVVATRPFVVFVADCFSDDDFFFGKVSFEQGINRKFKFEER